MSASITATIDIDASPRAVWEVLTDFAAYPDWNPFVDRSEGTPEVGTRSSSTWPVTAAVV